MLKPRKTHTKSRYGCDNCRRRRVKCDEQGPPCTNCILRRLDNCTYSRVLPASLLANARRASESTLTASAGAQSQSHAGSSTGHVLPSPGQPGPSLNGPPVPSSPGLSVDASAANSINLPIHPAASAGVGIGIPSPSVGVSSGANVEALELMHQFTAETYQSLCVSESEIPTWQLLVPRLALQHRYLMHGILALASLHIATTRVSDDALAYIDAGLEYHSLSLEPFRIVIGNLTPENCDAAFAQSVVTTAISLALPQLTATRENAVRMTDNVLTVFELLQGVKKILTIGQRQSWIHLGLFSQGEFWKKDSFTKLDPDTDAALDQLKALNESVSDSVSVDVINHLRHCFRKFTCSSDPAPVLAWLAAVDKSFVECLRLRQPFALLVLAYWGILLSELDGHRWWARNSGQALVLELMGGLSVQGQDPAWESCIAWVRQRVARIPRSAPASVSEGP